MGEIDIEALETTEVPAGEPSVEKEVIEKPSTEEVVKEATEKTIKSVKTKQDSGKVSGKTAEVEKPVEKQVEKVSDVFKVGEKEYTREQAIKDLEKVGRFQGDRDRAEATIERIVGQLRQAGYNIDQNFNIVPQQAQPQMPDRQQLTMLAAAGDNEAFNALLEMNNNDVVNRVFGNLQQVEQQKGIIEKVRKDYPDFYGPDGQPNLESPISKEAARIIEQHPQFAGIQYLPYIAELAEARILKGNFKNLEQQITDKAHQKLAQGASQGLGTPNGAMQETPGEFSPEQAAFARKLGVNSDRIGKIIQRAQEKGGYEL